MRIKLNSILVDDQAKALAFYTEILGFEKCHDIPAGEFRWLTVTSPDGHPDVELAIEPNQNADALTFQAAMFEQGIPFTAFEVDSTQAEYDRLSALGVQFTMKPTDVGPTTVAIFADTCGNLIQIYEGAS